MKEQRNSKLTISLNGETLLSISSLLILICTTYLLTVFIIYYQTPLAPKSLKKKRGK